MIRLAALLSFLLFGQTVAADTAGEGFFFAPTLLYYSLDYEENNATSKETRTDLDISFGYSLGNLMLGAKYYNSQIEYGSNDTTTTAIGAIVGFEHKGFKLLGSYNFLNVEKKVDEPRIEYSDGKGIILEAMYICDFGNWGFGPKLFYKNFTFDSQKQNGRDVEGFGKRTEKELLPFFALYFKI